LEFCNSEASNWMSDRTKYCFATKWTINPPVFQPFSTVNSTERTDRFAFEVRISKTGTEISYGAYLYSHSSLRNKYSVTR
jgi:hypothetical protein